MALPPPLLAVSSSLFATFHGLPRVVQLVSSFLLPHNIDSAVYNELHRAVLPSGSLTSSSDYVPAGRRAAPVPPSSMQDLNVLEWHYDIYPQVANSAEEIVKAAQCGHIDVTRFLESKTLLRRPYNMRKSLLAAAGNGQTRLMQFLLKRGYSVRYGPISDALDIAAYNDQIVVLEFLLDICPERQLKDSSFHESITYVIETAVWRGNIKMTKRVAAK
ncbi:hypothetical protein JG688_00012039, partial [Phytophthora aleatoria]